MAVGAVQTRLVEQSLRCDANIIVEGHCDERGTTEYNLALGERRATETKKYLVELGVPEGRIKTISYGEERPVCRQHDESCWSKNRRVEIELYRALPVGIPGTPPAAQP